MLEIAPARVERFSDRVALGCSSSSVLRKHAHQLEPAHTRRFRIHESVVTSSAETAKVWLPLWATGQPKQERRPRRCSGDVAEVIGVPRESRSERLRRIAF